MNGDRDRRSAGFAALLGELDARALVLLSAAGDDPERAFFVHPAKLGEALVVVRPGAAPRLGYLTPMERDEAAATGLDLLTPEDLDVARWGRDTPEAGAFHANVLAQALQRTGVAPGRIALAGRLPFGLAGEVLARLAGEGWSFVSASDALLRIRKHKTAAEMVEIRRVAGVTVQARVRRPRALELIVGDIRDEGDVERPDVERGEGGRLWLASNVTLDVLSDLTGEDLRRGDVSTIGGLVMDLLGRVPRAGEELMIAGHRLVVERVVRRRIERVYLEPLVPVAAREDVP